MKLNEARFLLQALFSFHEDRGEPFVSNCLIPAGLGTGLEMRLAVCVWEIGVRWEEGSPKLVPKL